jgi:putative PIN family toxin of toxin-antitoxin system
LIRRQNTVTVGTNVVYAGLYSRAGASNRILQYIIDEELVPAITSPVYFEYCDVLTRPESLAAFELKAHEVGSVLDAIALLARKHRVHYLLRSNLLDESDNIFLECAFASNTRYLITSNVKHFTSGELLGFEKLIVTPSEFLRRMNE